MFGGPAYAPGGAPLNLGFLFAAAMADPTDPADAVVVEGKRLDPVSASVTVVPVLGLPAATELSDVVDSTPGTNVHALGALGDWSAVSIRGSTLRQVIVCIDGIPLNPDGSSVVNLSELPLDAFSQVEVWRGNAPAQFGVAPIGGVVNLVTSDQKVSGISANFGSFATGRASALLARPGKVDGWLFADAFGTKGDFRYFSDNGTLYNRTDDAIERRTNNDKWQGTLHGRLRFDVGSWTFSLMDAFLSRREGIPGPSGARLEEVRLHTHRNLLVGQAEVSKGTGSGLFRVWSQWRQEDLQDPGEELFLATAWQRDRTHSIGILARGAWSPTSWWTPSMVVDGRMDQFRAYERDLEDRAEPRRRLAVTASLSSPFQWWGHRIFIEPVVQATVRHDAALGTVERVGEAPVEPEQTRVRFSPRLGARFRPWPFLALKGNIGLYHRAPDLLELFGDSGSMRGNPELTVEEGWQADVGVHGRLPENSWMKLDLEVGYFWNSSQDTIVLVQNSQRVLYPINLGKTWVQGLEVGVNADFAEWAGVAGSLTQTTSVNLSEDPTYSNNPLPRMPPLEVDLRHWANLFGKVRLGHGFTYAAPHAWDATGWYVAPSRSLHRVFVEAEIPKGPTVGLEVRNLANVSVETVPRNPLNPEDSETVQQAITDYVGYPLAGRAFVASVRWNL